jgi:hypothetical protein
MENYNLKKKKRKKKKEKRKKKKGSKVPVFLLGIVWEGDRAKEILADLGMAIGFFATDSRRDFQICSVKNNSKKKEGLSHFFFLYC